MQIILQKSKVYLIFYIFLSKILSIFTSIHNTRATHSLSRPYLIYKASRKIIPSLDLGEYRFCRRVRYHY